MIVRVKVLVAVDGEEKTVALASAHIKPDRIEEMKKVAHFVATNALGILTSNEPISPPAHHRD